MKLSSGMLFFSRDSFFVDSSGHIIFEAARPVRSHGPLAACAPIHPFVITAPDDRGTPGVNDTGTDDFLRLS